MDFLPEQASRLPIADTLTSWRHAGRLLRPRLTKLAATTVLLLAGSGSALLVPPVLGWLVDAVIAGADFARLAFLATVLLVSGIVSALLLRSGSRLLISALQETLAQLREEAFEAAIRLDQGSVEDAGTSDVVSRITGDVEAITAAVSDVLPRFVQAGFTIVLTLIGLALLDPRLAAAALLALPIQVFTTAVFLRRSRPLYSRLRREEAERGQAIIESVQGAETVIAHSTQAAHLARVAERSLVAVETQREASIARNRFNAGLNFAEFIGLGAVLLVGYWLSSSAGLSVGAVTAAALFFHRLFGPIGALLSSIDDLQRATAGLSRLVGIVETQPRFRAKQQIERFGIKVTDLHFAYSKAGPVVLRDVNLTFPAGSTTVLVGVSGSGKSTLAQLIAGTLSPGTGAVLIGGAPAREAVAGDRPAVLLVAQDTHLFSGTLAENLRLAAPEATDDQLWAALAQVQAGWAKTLPGGLHAELPHDLADAWLQQLALARVLLADPPIVVLDEATAHGGADGSLDHAVSAVTSGRTAIIVAHRFVQAETADQIVVLHNGQLVEQGKHEELLQDPASLYAALVTANTTV